MRVGAVVLLEDAPEHESALLAQHHSQRAGQFVLLLTRQS